MKIAIGLKIYDSEEIPILIQYSAQDRLDVIGMPPNKNIFITAPNIMEKQDIEKWVQDVITKLNPKFM